MTGKKGLGLAALMVSSALLAQNAEWTPGATSLADGAVSIAYDASDAVTRLLANVPDGEKLTIVGSDAMAFASGAQVVVSNGTLRFETPLTGAGGLSVRYVADDFVWDAVESGRNDYLPQSEADAVVVAKGVLLDDLTVDHCSAGMKNLHYYWGNGEANVKPYFIERGEGTLSCQMQHVSDVWTKCIWLNLKQVGDDVVAWTPKVGYAHYQNVAPLGTDFRTITYTSAGCSCVKTQTAGYGIDGLTLVPNGGGMVCAEVANGLDLAGTLTVGAGLTLVADGATALTTNGVWNVPLQVNGTFRLADPYGLTMGGIVKFGTYGRYEGRVENALPEVAAGELNAPKWPSANWSTIATNVSISAVTDVTAKTGGGTWFDGGTATALNQSWIERDGNVLTVQYTKNWDQKYIKGVVYQIQQSGPYLQHRIVRSAYYETAKDVDASKLDLRKQGLNMAIYNGGANGNANGYGLQDVKIRYGAYVPHCVLRLTNAFYTDPRGYTHFEGLPDAPLDVVCEEAGGMPANYEIGAYAFFAWCGTGFGGNGNASMQVDENGEFAMLRGWNWESHMTANVNGGTFRVFPWTVAGDATWIYLEKVNFLNGGHVADNIPRVGYYVDPVWTVRGSKPAYIDKGLGVVGNGEGTGSPFNRAMTLDVADVTGSDEPDLYVSGKIYYSNSEWKMAHMVKLGAGKVRHDGVMSVNTYPMVISNGVWQVTQSNGIVAGCGLELSGGGLELDAGCTLSLGALTVGAGSTNTVALGSGSAISFASVGAVKDARVNFTVDDLTKKVRIGTGPTLTSTQRRAIKVNGKSVHQDDAGYLVEGPVGSVVIVK